MCPCGLVRISVAVIDMLNVCGCRYAEKDGATALIAASYAGALDVVKFLLEYGE